MTLIKSPKDFFHFGVLHFDRVQGFLDPAETGCIIGLVDGAGLVLVLTVVLDFLARIFDFGQSERGRRPLEEMSLGAECAQVALLPNDI